MDTGSTPKNYVDTIFSMFLPNLKWEKRLSIHAIKREIAMNNLHSLIVAVKPTVVRHIEPAKTNLQRMINAVKSHVCAMASRKEDLITNPKPNPS